MNCPRFYCKFNSIASKMMHLGHISSTILPQSIDKFANNDGKSWRPLLKYWFYATTNTQRGLPLWSTYSHLFVHPVILPVFILPLCKQFIYDFGLQFNAHTRLFVCCDYEFVISKCMWNGVLRHATLRIHHCHCVCTRRIRELNAISRIPAGAF